MLLLFVRRTRFEDGVLHDLHRTLFEIGVVTILEQSPMEGEPLAEDRYPSDVRGVVAYFFLTVEAPHRALLPVNRTVVSPR